MTWPEDLTPEQRYWFAVGGFTALFALAIYLVPVLTRIGLTQFIVDPIVRVVVVASTGAFIIVAVFKSKFFVANLAKKIALKEVSRPET